MEDNLPCAETNTQHIRDAPSINKSNLPQTNTTGTKTKKSKALHVHSARTANTNHTQCNVKSSDDNQREGLDSEAVAGAVDVRTAAERGQRTKN